MKKVYVASTSPAAHLISLWLDERGIPNDVQGDSAGIGLGPVVSSASVWVAEGDFEEAVRLLKQRELEQSEERLAELGEPTTQSRSPRRVGMRETAEEIREDQTERKRMSPRDFM